MRDYSLYLKDILIAIEKIERYSKNISNYQEFLDNELIIDAIIRNVEIMGEAVKNIPERLKEKYKTIEWKKIAGMRDVITHVYFGINQKILFEVVKNKLPELKIEISKILEENKSKI